MADEGFKRKLAATQTNTYYIDMNFGLIFMEAGCCGKPSILYDIKEMPDFVDDKKTGFIVNNYEELKERAISLIEFPSIAKRMGRKAYEKYKKYTWKKCAKDYVKWLKEYQ